MNLWYSMCVTYFTIFNLLDILCEDWKIFSFTKSFLRCYPFHPNRIHTSLLEAKETIAQEKHVNVEQNRMNFRDDKTSDGKKSEESFCALTCPSYPIRADNIQIL